MHIHETKVFTHEKETSIEKALNILMAFIPENHEVRTIEMSRELGLNKATTSRILLTLTRKRFLHQDPNTKTFKLGQSALLLGRAVIDSLNSRFIQIAKKHMDSLRSTINTTVTMEQMINDRSIIIAVSEGQQRIRLARNIGESLPIHTGAGAKAYFAFTNPEIIGEIVNRIETFEKYTPNTITSKDELIKNLKEAKRNGYSLDDEESDIGVKAIGMPIFDYRNVVIACLGVVFPAHKIGKNIDPDLLSKIKHTVECISDELTQSNQNGS